MKALIATIAITTATTASAWTWPNYLQLDGLHCTIFDSNGRYYCEDTKPAQAGQASNTLILDFDELVKMNAKPVKESSHVHSIASR